MKVFKGWSAGQGQREVTLSALDSEVAVKCPCILKSPAILGPISHIRAYKNIL